MIFLRSSNASIVRVTHEDRAMIHFSSLPRLSQLLGIGLLCLSIGMGASATAQVSGQVSLAAQDSQQAFTPAPLDAGFGPLNTAQPKGITPQQIIQRFAGKETQFKRALENYTYRRTVKLDSIEDNGGIDGEYLQVDDIVLSPSGLKQEKVIYAPYNTLTRALLSPADFDDVENRLPFTLTTEDVAQYRVTYVGTERVDQVDTYVFDVAPRHMAKDQRYFSGRIWVDAKDFQIVVTNGKNIPDDIRRGQEDLSIPFTTYRQQIDGKYWFPVYTRAEGVLHFKNCKACLPSDVHLREIVRYGDYKQFGSSIRITYEGLERPTGLPANLPGNGPTGPRTASAGPAVNTFAQTDGIAQANAA
ncbi:MAG TPA: hypothetical protein VE195_02385, partial [Acidobacteriaceae bacterium]|nr:hypothetical protein [Acidobacteriaceae bacterium]